MEGALTEHDVYTLAQHYLTPTQLAAVKEAQSSGAVHDALLTNQALAQHMDFSGTPAFVVMPQTQDGDVKRVTVIIHFMGSVVEAGCWNDVGTLEIQCHNKEGVERYIIVENIITPISSPHATVKRDYLDEDKQLTVLRIVYD